MIGFLIKKVNNIQLYIKFVRKQLLYMIIKTYWFKKDSAT